MFYQDYEKLWVVASGAFSTVFKVRHAELGYIRALKVCNDFIDDRHDMAWQTFLKECKVLVNIGNGSHPNIVRVYQPRLIGNRALLEMDYIEGENLQDFIKREGFVPYDEFANFAEQIVSALAYCHIDVYKNVMNPLDDDLSIDPADGRKYLVTPEKERELVDKYGGAHNDLHSGNIMRRNNDGKYILLDFGLALHNRHCVRCSSRPDDAIEYSSPEKLSDGVVSTRSDVYSLGILLYEMLTGGVPFSLKNVDAVSPEAASNKVFWQHLNELPPSIFEKRKKAFEAKYPGRQYSPDYPRWMEALILKCLDKHPENRFGNAREIAEEIARHTKDNEAVILLKREYEGKLRELEASQQVSLKKIEELENAKLSNENRIEELLAACDGYKSRISKLQAFLSGALSASDVAKLNNELNSYKTALEESENKLKEAREQLDRLSQENAPLVPVSSFLSGKRWMWLSTVLLAIIVLLGVILLFKG